MSVKYFGFEPATKALDAPLKLLMKDVGKIQKNHNNPTYPWKITLPVGPVDRQSVILEISQVWLQGYITKLEDSPLDTIIMTDGTGDVKVSKCSRVPGDRSWIEPGAYCSLMACVMRTSGLIPVLAANKLMYISENRTCAEDMWPLEVQELCNILTNQVSVIM